MRKPAFHRAEPDARRQSLIDACARVLARAGAAGISVRGVAIEAGVSPGLVSNYFAGIDALVADTYAEISAVVSTALDAAVGAAGGDARARLDAYVNASFAPPIADRDLLATWIAFWTLVIARPEIARLHDDQYAGYRATIAALLADCGMGADRVRIAAIGIAALVDGLWLELCLSPDCITPTDAGAIIRGHLDSLLASGG